MQHKLQLLFVAPLVLMAGCSGSSSSGGSAGAQGVPSGFQLIGLSVRNGEILPINRAIEMEFTQPVDFRSVTPQTIRITSGLLSASGSFTQKRIDTNADGIPDTVDPRVIVWQPACPLLDDFSDAGLRPGGFTYQIVITGGDRSRINSVRSTSGTELRVTQVRDFTTPLSTNAAVIFLDPVLGSPAVLVRAPTSTLEEGVSYVEIGSNPNPASRIYFERGLGGGVNTISPGALAPSALPLNLYADAGSEVAFVLFFNQPVNPSTLNISATRLAIEYQVPGTSNWVAVETNVQLVTNCVDGGAQVRLEPVGGLPADGMVRAVVRAGFEGLVGNTDSSSSAQDRFAVVPTMAIDNTSLASATAGADGILEEFDLAAGSVGSREDPRPILINDVGAGIMVLETPASWGDGGLTSRFAFDGTGGVGGDFDWYVNDGVLEMFDTSSQAIVGGVANDGATQFTTGGLVNVRDFVIEADSSLRITGPNPLIINATGTVRIDGLLDISGQSAEEVTSVNSGNVPVLGGAGVAGGGDGGIASGTMDSSTQRGGRGFGAFNMIGGGGGQGGESGGAIELGGVGPDSRRPGGGGGGAFNVDQDDSSASLSYNTGAALNGQVSNGMVAEPGTRGNILSRGAETNEMPSLPGNPGSGPFVDGDDTNNFYGRRADVTFTVAVDRTRPVGSTPTQIISGELTGLHAGAGGGAGGDALTGDFFPTPNWTPSSDEQGGGGGGGGGALHIRALGPITMSGLSSQILCRGGQGATGENSFAFNQVGGTGGSGSGGHVVLESAAYISFEHADFSDQHLFIDARGGIENLGRNTDGSATNNVLPAGISDGGQGGPGLIQLHMPNSSVAPDDVLDLGNPLASRLILPLGTIDQLDMGDASVLNEIMRPAGEQMIPSFSSVSRARSTWVDLGAVDTNPAGGLSLIQFLFDGVNPADGAIRTGAGMVTELTELLGPDPLSATAQIQGTNTLVLSGTALDDMRASSGPQGNDLYLRAPGLLRNCILRMTPAVGSPVAFNVESATYSNVGPVLTLTVSGVQDLSTFAGQAPAAMYTLIPRFFSVTTGGNENALPDGSTLRFSFDLAGRDPSGLPDEGNLLVMSETDISVINNFLFTDFTPDQNGTARFLRMNFEFDLNSDNGGLTNQKQPVTLNFVRVPFSY